jgi:hypothetical protein
MSSNFFCSNCGEQIPYSLKKPNFCPACGYNFSSASFKSATSNRRTELTSDRKSIDKLDFEVEVERPETTTLASLLKQPKTGFSRGEGGSLSGPDLIKQIESECSSNNK